MSIEPSPAHQLSDIKGMEEYMAALSGSDRPRTVRAAEQQPASLRNPDIRSVPLHDPKCTWLENLCIEKMDPQAYIPTKELADDAGYDLYAFEPAFVPAWGSYLAKLKIKMAIPPNLYGRIASRSGLAAKHNIEVGAGVVDRSYRGEICVLLRNFSDYPYEIKRGDRIAQMILTPYRTVETRDTRDLASLFGNTARGAAGFGSSGK